MSLVSKIIVPTGKRTSAHVILYGAEANISTKLGAEVTHAEHRSPRCRLQHTGYIM